MRYHKFAIFIVAVLASTAFAQHVLRNSDIVDMVRSGIPESVIITKIKNSPVEFDTSTAALKVLVDWKVPESVMAAMIERSNVKPEVIGPAPPPPVVVDPVRGEAAGYTPYSQLDKKTRKERLKAPVALEIAAPATTVSTLMIRGFQANGYRIEQEGPQSLNLVKDMRGFGTELLAGMAGGSNVQFKVAISLAEYRGVTRVGVMVWLSMQNAYGKPTTSDSTRNEKTRLPLEDLLYQIKTEAER